MPRFAPQYAFVTSPGAIRRAMDAAAVTVGEKRVERNVTATAGSSDVATGTHHPLHRVAT